MRMKPGRSAWRWMTAACAAIPAGCASAPPSMESDIVYPAHVGQREMLDIQVVQHATTIEFTNTTARAFGPCRMWLNARFSRALDGLRVGETLTLNVSEFRDEFNESFRHGGFWATRPGDRLVLAQIEVPPTGGGEKPSLLGLVVVGRPAN